MIKDLTGQRFERLFVIKPTDQRKSGCIVWLCRCDCGNLIYTTTNHLTMGDTKSCGCLNREKASERTIRRNYKHGEGQTRGSVIRLYRIWLNMKSRCLNSNVPSYRFYGKKGISVCFEWHEYLPFKTWALTNGYANNLTIDRINHKGNYEPDNCQWITASENSKKSNTERHIP